LKYKLVKISNISGEKASVYSILLNDEEKAVFENFLKENINSFKSELTDILSRLIAIGKVIGAREQFFKINEGKPGDGVCALYDRPNSFLRLYCIRYGYNILILGGGGPKSKSIRTLGEEPKLKAENSFLRKVSADITKRMNEGGIYFSDDNMDFEGNLVFNDDDDE
jgi:hypothetical protein